MKYKKRFIIKSLDCEGDVSKSSNNLGSVAKFLGTTVLLVAVLVGGIYFAKGRNASFAAQNNDTQQIQQPEVVQIAPENINSSGNEEAVSQSDQEANSLSENSTTQVVANEVPSTGVSGLETAMTATLIFMSVYLYRRIYSMRTLYRKLLS